MGIPVIIDTDVGTDVDDMWALAFALRCPELDIRLITTCTGNVEYRAALVAKLLEVAGRTDIPIGLGLSLDAAPEPQKAWIEDYQLDLYPGVVLKDGVGAICDTVNQSENPVTLIAIGPLPNIAAALQRAPSIIENSKFIGMHGSLRIGYLGAPKPMKEYNVKQHALSCKSVFEAGWEKEITPLDTCGNIILTGDNFQRVRNSADDLVRAVIENHLIWYEAVASSPVVGPFIKKMDPQIQSSILYDCVAIYMAFSSDGLVYEKLPITITEDGKTLIDDDGSVVNCATSWSDIEAFYSFLSARLT
tara:strand:- start:339 stop:1250 length:912 start_codon:yes stop_codon:yes gene_type:complete